MDKKIITLITDVGYYHPSNANWSYHIHILIDATGARFYRDTFGGDRRMIEKFESQGYEIEKLYAGKGSNTQYKWSEVKHFNDIENYDGKNY